MFRFVTIIPLSFWAIIMLMLFMWFAMGLCGWSVRLLYWRCLRADGLLSAVKGSGRGPEALRITQMVDPNRWHTLEAEQP